MDEKISNTIKALDRNHMKGFYVSNKEDLLTLLAQLIAPGSSVGCGDSITLEQTGVFDYLRHSGHEFWDKHAPSLSLEKKQLIYLKNFDVDTFITGTNAVTMQGELFNIDGNGSRVAPMLYGPKQVIVVVGVNKIVEDVEQAIHRVRQIAAPLDAKRLGKNTPCVKLGYCINCKHPERICNDFVLIAGQFIKERIKVIIVEAALGY